MVEITRSSAVVFALVWLVAGLMVVLVWNAAKHSVQRGRPLSARRALAADDRSWSLRRWAA
jgi:hypothetical protein